MGAVKSLVEAAFEAGTNVADAPRLENSPVPVAVLLLLLLLSHRDLRFLGASSPDAAAAGASSSGRFMKDLDAAGFRFTLRGANMCGRLRPPPPCRRSNNSTKNNSPSQNQRWSRTYIREGKGTLAGSKVFTVCGAGRLGGPASLACPPGAPDFEGGSAGDALNWGLQ